MAQAAEEGSPAVAQKKGLLPEFGMEEACHSSVGARRREIEILG